jgi:16S rRNA (uracil1498-N3)-methyltransferase
MRLHRFYVNKPLGEEIVVENGGGGKGYNSKLLHQWTHVFRYTSGDEVFLFSAATSGTDYLYRISSISKQAITLAPVSSVPNITPDRNVTLVMALVKKDTFETIVRQATELGVSRIIPLIADRSEKKNLNPERLQAISIEASEQSGRGTLPEITKIMTMEEALKATTDSFRIIGSLHGEGTATCKSVSGEASLWVGPEGGWTDKEEALAKEHGFHTLKLGETVLKADTAAVALLSSYLALSSGD